MIARLGDACEKRVLRWNGRGWKHVGYSCRFVHAHLNIGRRLGFRCAP